MKAEEIEFLTMEHIEDAQQIQIALQNTQNELWKRLKTEVAKQINVRPAIPVDNSINTLGYDTENGKRMDLYFNLDNTNLIIPQFHIGALIYNVGQEVIEETFLILNISVLIDSSYFAEVVETYANWIKKQLEANKN